jgi:hypothetical protein
MLLRQLRKLGDIERMRMHCKLYWDRLLMAFQAEVGLRRRAVNLSGLRQSSPAQPRLFSGRVAGCAAIASHSCKDLSMVAGERPRSQQFIPQR